MIIRTGKYSGQQVNKHQLAMGIKIEREHTSNPQTARRIALDHLVGENYRSYYTALTKMERSLRKRK